MSKILIVDDDPSMVCLLTEFMEAKFCDQKQHTVVSLSNPQEALQKIKDENPQLILLDISMPGKNGVDLLREIMDFDPEMNVIMVTGVEGENWAWMTQASLKIGARDYVRKPVNFEHLEKAVWPYLSR